MSKKIETPSQVSLTDFTGNLDRNQIAGRDIIIYNYYYQAEITSTPAPEPDSTEPLPENPYLGLFAFRPEHADLFFGREAFTDSLVKAVESRRLVTVLGASGSGKSSVVFAGLVPTLADRPGEPWLFTTFRPGDDPFHNLASALVPLYETGLDHKTAQIGATSDLATSLQQKRYSLAHVLGMIRQEHPDHRLLLIADQFEELYTLCRDPQARHTFLDTLLTVVNADSLPLRLHLVLTLRADFLGQASLYRPLADALQGTIALLGPMKREELTRAIEQPAAKRGVTFQDKLVERLLDDVGQAEGSLPLLEFALSELWRQQQQRTLTLTAYEEIGQVKGALSRHADRTYTELETADEREQARRVLVQLVNPGAGTEDTRRLATRHDLEQNWPLVTKLASQRLVVTNRVEDGLETVEVVHEALIRNWPQLRHWLEADREFLTWRLGLEADLKRWQETDHDDGALLRGAPLAIAKEYLAKRAKDLTSPQRDFIQASINLEAKEAAEREAQRQRELESARKLAEEAEARRQAEAQRAQEAEAREKEQAAATAKLRRQTLGLAVAGLVAVVLAVTAVIFGIWARDSEAAAQAEREKAEAAAQSLAEQNEKAQAELNFYQTTDPAERLTELYNLFSRGEAGSRARARSLFFGLRRVEQLALLAVTDRPKEQAAVSRAILPNLADINGIYYTNEHLTTLADSLAEGERKQEVAAWLAAREAAEAGDYDTALRRYTDLLSTTEQNPALWYERARLQAKRGQTAEALADLARVMDLAQAPDYESSGLPSVGQEFANSQQMAQAVQRLMLVYDDLAAEHTDYPSLAEIKLPTVKRDDRGVPMVLVPAGPFNMGSNAFSNEQPVHKVYLDAYTIDQYEVTNERFVAFLQDQGKQTEGGVRWLSEEWSRISPAGDAWRIEPGYEAHPVTGVSWYGAKAYCEWRGGRLPTEAEWEKAARGDDERTYPWGEEIADHLLNYYGNVGDTTPVGQYPEGVSPYGVYDLAGNVWEWVADAYDSDYYQNSPPRNPTGPADDQNERSKVLRGGSWDHYIDYARASFRLVYDPDVQYVYIGIRCVGSAPE